MKKIKVLLLYFIIIASLVVITGCDQDKVVLNMYNWGQYIDTDLITKFEKETGIKVNYEMFETNEHMLAKIESGSSYFDLVFPSDYVIEEMISKDMLHKIDFTNIPNFQYIDDRFKNLEYDPENEYSVPYFWGTLGILYNSEEITQTVDSWDILWDEKYSGQILMLDSMRDTIGVALKRKGYSLNSVDSKQLLEAREMLIEQKLLHNGYYVDETMDMMINGDANIALNWSGAAMDIYWQGAEHIKYALPKEGSNLWVDCMVIPKSSKLKKEAEMFINFILDPDNAYQNTDYVGYSTPNKIAFERILEDNPEVADMDAYNPNQELLDKCEVFIDLGDNRAIYNQLWTEIKVY
ncbi:MAG TPA: spermidine/putrescine ABC transporter substrate-binding protein [Thermoclostridium sp.]|nr:spermidine/putrescine ABC transporter substrate-binding protein [Thermoclostridium sp.]